MRICLKESKNFRWIVFTVLISLALAQGMEQEDAEILGEILLLAGAVFIVLSL